MPYHPIISNPQKRRKKRADVINKCCLLLFLSAVFSLQGCDYDYPPARKYIDKKVLVSLEGIPEDTYPWVSLKANTEYAKSLFVVQGEDILVRKDGVYEADWGSVSPPGNVMLFLREQDSVRIFLEVSYLKRMERTPSDSDNLTVRVQGYTDGVLRLDTTRVMRAFGKEEKTELSDYTFGLSF